MIKNARLSTAQSVSNAGYLDLHILSKKKEGKKQSVLEHFGPLVDFMLVKGDKKPRESTSLPIFNQMELDYIF